MYKYPLNCFCITISNLSFIFFVLPIYLYSIFPQKFELISCGLIFSLNSEMEIDFLGLISKQSQKLEKGRRKNTFKDSAIRGADISLSLSTISSSVDLKGEPLSFGEINGWTVPINKMIPTCEGSLEKDHAREKLSRACVQTPINKLSSTTGFPYDLNEKPTDSRNIFEPTAQPAFLTLLHSGAAHVFHEILPDKANHLMRVSSKSSLVTSTNEKCTRGYRYTPTVAMARRATLARFLEKRMHRLTRTKTANVTRKSPDATSSQTWNVNRRCNRKNNSIIKL
ncbi:Hypothetical predicted protein [Olea europaea subsp. europaea]|uniref:Protein TIFY n=1 Tax=Olea europaea subsp. europaea TaxID=158383 RepID=A0A8S0V880_OLEEU|nr:Hypothetical predicted protein [Olea europaea subsp. europaea]